MLSESAEPLVGRRRTPSPAKQDEKTVCGGPPWPAKSDCKPASGAEETISDDDLDWKV